MHSCDQHLDLGELLYTQLDTVQHGNTTQCGLGANNDHLLLFLLFLLPDQQKAILTPKEKNSIKMASTCSANG